MDKLWIDFETYCDLDIKKVGLYKYVNHSSFCPWCASYAIDDETPQIWEYPETAPERLVLALTNPTMKIYAHNAEFEWQVLKRIGYGISLKQFVDTQALAAIFGYPLSLDKFCKAVGLSVSKDTKGTRLINKLCKPQKKTMKNPSGRWYPNTAPKDFDDLYTYCKQDVIVMRKAVKCLPQQQLSRIEQYIWMHTILQNSRGIRVDVKTVRSIVYILKKFKFNGERELRIATGGSVRTAKQIAKIKNFLGAHGLTVNSLDKETVSKLLTSPMHPVCKQVLKLRQRLAHSSTAKFDKMLEMVGEDDKIRGNLVYYGGHTGRFAGRGLQVHNLLRAQVDNPEEVIRIFNEYNYKLVEKLYPDVNETATKLVRPMLIADKEENLLVADYSSVENVVLHWAAGDEKTTQDFREGLCQYKVYSASRLGMPYAEVTKEQRTQSKPDVLGLGFGGGYRALVHVAAGYGVSLDQHEAQERVNFYRNKYKLIPQLWRRVFAKAKEAIVTKDPQILITKNIKLEFRCAGGYLFILLPSGRRLSYPRVKLDALWYITVKGKQVPMSSEISYMGVKSGAWLRIGTHPGMLVENIIQALARDLLAYGLLCAEQAGYKIIISIHDEAVASGKQTDIKEFCEYLCTKQSWAKTIPLRAEGYIAKRYRKD